MLRVRRQARGRPGVRFVAPRLDGVLARAIDMRAEAGALDPQRVEDLAVGLADHLDYRVGRVTDHFRQKAVDFATVVTLHLEGDGP